VAVVAVAAAIEDGLGDPGRLGPLGEQLAGARAPLALGSERSSGSNQLTAASVRADTSSIIWAERPCWSEHGDPRRAAVPDTLARTRRRRLSL